jgi:hypothetical protein
MELLRLPPYDDLTFDFIVPDLYTEETTFFITVTRLSDLSTTVIEESGQAGDDFHYTLSYEHDDSFRIEFRSELPQHKHLYDDTIELVRPYVSPYTLGQTASEIAEYTKYEEIARAIIDSIIPEGFYYKRKTLEVVGLGADYIPLWWDAKRILAVYENDVLVEDRTYEITRDKTAITETVLDGVNRNEQAPLILPAAGSDLVDTVLPPLRGFPNGYDYKFVLEVGYPSVPSDIVRAATLLIDDIKCGRNDYYQRYISAYNTDQFRLQFDSRVFEGTGNIIVDKILSKYAKSITRLGVL